MELVIKLGNFWEISGQRAGSPETGGSWQWAASLEKESGVDRIEDSGENKTSPSPGPSAESTVFPWIDFVSHLPHIQGNELVLRAALTIRGGSCDESMIQTSAQGQVLCPDDDLESLRDFRWILSLVSALNNWWWLPGTLSWEMFWRPHLGRMLWLIIYVCQELRHDEGGIHASF